MITMEVVMYQDQVVLCGASAYEKKFYLNPDFNSLPQQVKDELKIACVLYTAEVGGVITLEFDEDGNLNLVASSREDDLLFDEIGSALKIKDMQIKKRDLWETLELYYRVFFLGEELETQEN